MKMNAAQRAAYIVGGITRLAELIGTSKQQVETWCGRGWVAATYAPQVEEATRKFGKPVLAERLCPNVQWSIIRSYPSRGTGKKKCGEHPTPDRSPAPSAIARAPTKERDT